MSSGIKDFVDAVKTENEEPTKVYEAIVSGIDDEGIVWVNIAGSGKETPTASTSTEVKTGDIVNVEWRNNKLYIAGNYSNPSAGSQRVDIIENTANKAVQDAQRASVAALSAETSAEQAQASASTAQTAAQQAVTDAAAADAKAVQAKQAADDAESHAQTALTNAGLAQDAADAAQISAENASGYAARALGNLSTVQSVSETLTWITQHGTMTLTSDTALDPTHVYFVVDPNGDYTVGSTKYSVVTEPDVADISTYYELSIDESLNNYVGTHLALDGEGLWLLPASSGTNKVLIATGAGSTYTTAGTYIIDSGGSTVASFKTNGITLGSTGDAQMLLDYNTLQMKDKDNNSQLHIGDLRGSNGLATVAETFRGDGYQKDFQLFCLTNDGNVTKVEVESVVVSNYTVNQNSMGYYIRFTTAPNDGDVIVVTYTTSSDLAKQYTFGLRNPNRVVGPMSFVFGYGNSAESPNAVAFPNSEAIANGSFAITQGHALGAGSYAAANGYALGLASHADGDNAYATGVLSFALGAGNISGGDYSHSTGKGTNAGGDYSHAQNWGTIASSTAQTAIGKCNVEDTANTYAVIVGNGDPINAVQSNALTIDWSGNVEAAGDIEDGSGNVLSDKADSSTLAPVATSGEYSDLNNPPSIPTKTSDLTNDSGYITAETDPTVPSWAKASTKPTYTASEVGALPDTTTIPTKTSDLNNDSGFIMGLVAEKVLLADNITISGQTYGNGNKSVSKTGYTPIGIVGMHLQKASTGGQNNTTCAMHSWYLSGSTAYWIVRGTTTATAKIKVTATVLYVKS